MVEDQTSLFPELKAKTRTATATKKLTSNSQYGEEAVEILKDAGPKGMHVDDIVAEIIRRNSVLKDPPDYIKTKVTAYLSARAWKDGKPIVGSEIRRVMNPKTKTYKKGWYKYYKQPTPTAAPTLPPPPPTTQYFGAAGEFFVASEFLFYGFNVSRPAVDDGIDLTVFKKGKFSNVQVKTSSEQNGKFLFTVRNKALSNTAGIDTYYALVCRRVTKTGYKNDCVMLPSSSIGYLLATGTLSQSATSLSMSIVIKEDRFYLNGTENVTGLVNKFDIDNLIP